MHVEPYLYFDGRCEEAVDFYRRALGAELVTLVRFKDNPGTPAPAGAEEKVMHASLRFGSTIVLASDGQRKGTPSFQGFSLALTAADSSEAERLFAALAEGGQVQMPLMSTAFSPRFGMTIDRFGILWTISAEAGQRAGA